MREKLAPMLETSRVPRYTSYPTAPHFTASVTAADYSGWLAALDPGVPVSLYLHVPYCRQLCWYCGCNTHVSGDQGRIDAYVALLLRELDLVLAHLPGRMAVSHMHWGGGTPSILEPASFQAVMDRLAQSFDIAPDAERAIELDPRFLDLRMVETLAACGINRASLGVQTFDARVQQAINREQSAERTGKAVDRLRGAGIDRISFDVLYGLPHQTVESSRATAEAVLDMAPDRIAVFGYAHLPQRIRHQKMIDERALADAAGRWAQADAIETKLTRGGYARVGLDHFARPEDAMAKAATDGSLRRNFQGYTTDRATTLIGLGCSSIGNLPQGYVQSHADLPAWRDAIEAGRLPIARGIALSAQDRIDRDAIEAVMCRGEVDLGEIASRHGVTPAHCEPIAERFLELEHLGVVAREGRHIRVGDGLRPLWRLVAACFDRHLDPATARHALAV